MAHINVEMTIHLNFSNDVTDVKIERMKEQRTVFQCQFAAFTVDIKF